LCPKSNTPNILRFEIRTKSSEVKFIFQTIGLQICRKNFWDSSNKSKECPFLTYAIATFLVHTEQGFSGGNF